MLKDRSQLRDTQTAGDPMIKLRVWGLRFLALKRAIKGMIQGTIIGDITGILGVHTRTHMIAQPRVIRIPIAENEMKKGNGIMGLIWIT